MSKSRKFNKYNIPNLTDKEILEAAESWLSITLRAVAFNHKICKGSKDPHDKLVVKQSLSKAREIRPKVKNLKQYINETFQS